MSREEKKFFALKVLGNFLVLFAIFGVVSTFGPALYFETQFRVIQARGITYKIADGDIAGIVNGKESNQPSFGDLLVGAKEQEIAPPNKDFSIVIPKIGASSKVIANVNPADDEEYHAALKEGVAHSQGTVFPGLPGNIYMFSHSTDNFWNTGRYNAIFYLLKDLEEGDEIAVFFQGERHNYYVTHTKVVDPSEVSFITQANTGREQLILQTCWPPGTTWKRLLVFASPRNTDVDFKTD